MPRALCTQLDESCGGGDARELTSSDAEIRRHTRHDQSASGSSASGPCTALDTAFACVGAVVAVAAVAAAAAPVAAAAAE